MTARLAQADTTNSHPAIGRYQMAVVTITYSQSAWICSQRSACHRALPMYECARTRDDEGHQRGRQIGGRKKYTTGE